MPKGVLVPHRAITRLLINSDYIVFNQNEHLAQVSNTSFDALTFEVWGALLHGAQLIGISKDVGLSPAEFAAELERVQIDSMFLTASLFHEIARHKPAAFSRITNLLVGGEAVSPILVREVLDNCPPCRLLNAYGPTETTTFAVTAVISGADVNSARLPIGFPISNTEAYILDDQMNLCPEGIPGELYIGGDGLARGYNDRFDLTGERFVPHPISKTPGVRLYRTGDLCKLLPDGRIDILGRKDGQVKLRGFRLELSEIDITLRTHPSVFECITNLETSANENKSLVSYLVLRPGCSVTEKDLKDYLASKLPAFMVPAAVVFVGEIPLSPNGKIDRRKLSALRNKIEFRENINAVRSPKTGIEGLILEIWKELLERVSVDLRSNFFELGGHSLLATQMVSRLRAVLNVEVPLRLVFEKPSVESLSEAVMEILQNETSPKSFPIRPVTRDQWLPLSFAQERLWFLHQLGFSVEAYNIPGAVKLNGVLNVSAMDQAIQRIVARHEVLRTNFGVQQGKPVQVIRNDSRVCLTTVDFSELALVDRDECLRLKIDDVMSSAFDLVNDPLYRFQLYRISDDEHVFVFVLHHSIADGWSLGILVNELSALYRELATGNDPKLPELAVQYGDFSVWQRNWLGGDQLRKQLDYWTRQLNGAPAVLELPWDKPRPAIQSYEGAQEKVMFGTELMGQLETFSRRKGVTMFMTLLAGFKVLLHRFSGRTDIVVGTPIANRNRRETEGLIGFFVNTLALRSNLSSDPTFNELVNQIKETTLGAYSHQDLPFERIVQELQPERSLDHTPLFQVMFVLQNAASYEVNLGNLKLSGFNTEYRVSKFDLTTSVVETSSGLEVTFEYCTSLFNRNTIIQLIRSWERLLKGTMENPEMKVSQLPILTTAAEDEYFRMSTGPKILEQRDSDVPSLFNAQVAQRRDKVAVVFSDLHLSYQELNNRITIIAGYLKNIGVREGMMVGIYMEPGVDQLISMLAVLRAGGAYVPLDPDYPAKRILFVLADSSASVVLTTESEEGRLNDLIATDDGPLAIKCGRLEILKLEQIWEAVEQVKEEEVEFAERDSKNLAYVLYTSGSTGVPKGVEITHGSLSNLLQSMAEKPGFSSSDSMFAVTTLSFDIAALEILLPLITGGRVIVASRSILKDGKMLAAELYDCGATAMQATPALWRVLLSVKFEVRQKFKALCGGEALPKDLAEQLLERVSSLWNMYGPTETTIWSTCCEIMRGPERVTIGVPIANTQCFILDRNFTLVPNGVVGELYIGGTGLARGYRRRADLTAQKFIPYIFSGSEGRRLYATGDLCRRCPDGSIEFIGRKDDQVKIRGFRIEISEIENICGQHSEVGQCVVVARKTESGDIRLVAFVVPLDQTIRFEEKDLRNFLKARLPEYMIPAEIVVRETMPLTVNGKVDRRTLLDSAPRSNNEGKCGRMPDEIERELISLWKRIIGVRHVDVEDDFFKIGGHSIAAAELVAHIKEAFQVDLPLRALFESATVSGLADQIRVLMEAHDNQYLSRSRQIDLAAELYLDPIIRPLTDSGTPATTSQSVLLTGATGFLGAFLLQEILNQTSSIVYCLVRGNSTEDAHKRISSSLYSYGVKLEGYENRVIVLAGDLSKEKFGLPAEVYYAVAERVDAVYHNGAWVNFVFPYEVLKRTNVDGTKEVLRFACAGKLKAVHYVSTMSVLGNSFFTFCENESKTEFYSLDTGYAQTKWVAEGLIREAGKRGVPVAIYRPGKVSGHSKTGASNLSDLVNRSIKGFLQLGLMPKEKELNLVDNLAPVDYVCRAIVHLSQNPEVFKYAVFHLTNQLNFDWGCLFDYFTSRGFKIERVPYKEWRSSLFKSSELRENNALLPILYALPDREVFSDSHQNSIEASPSQNAPRCDNTTRMLECSGIKCPEITEQILDTYISYLFQSGFLDNKLRPNNESTAAEELISTV